MKYQSRRVRSGADPVGLYRFLNFDKDSYGEPFFLCSRHRQLQKIPSGCILTTMAEDCPGRGCVACCEEFLRG